MSELINADFSRRVVIATDDLPWIPSPQVGVERRMLDRIGGEVARATSLVRYAPVSVFPAHEHALGEEFLVLSGVFSDENGDYPAGTYVRNPPGSRHAPRTSPGCTILVKLRQMAPDDHVHVVVDTTQGDWQPGVAAGHSWLLLYSAGSVGEQVMMERLEAGARLPEACVAAGEEIFVLSGELEDECGRYGPNTWIRNTAGYARGLSSPSGVAYWSKRNHLRPA
ncbi:MAG: cupin domain-containing protein [Usitatibacteraceae bacterium]